MTKIETITAKIEALPDDEFEQLAVWFDALRERRFDEEILSDAGSGRLDALADEASADFHTGRTRRL